MKKTISIFISASLLLFSGAVVLGAEQIQVSVSPAITMGISIENGIISFGSVELGSTTDSIKDLAQGKTITNLSPFTMKLSIKSSPALNENGWTWDANTNPAKDAFVQYAYLDSDGIKTPNILSTGSYYPLGKIAPEGNDRIGIEYHAPTGTTELGEFTWFLTILAVVQ